MITLFQNGDQGSQSALVSTYNSLRGRGNAVLTALDQARTAVLVTLERRLSALNARRQRANRSVTPYVAGRVNVSDFIDIDQSTTTATVRIDAQSATLRERNQQATATVKSTKFSTDIGNVEEIDDLKRVTTAGGQTPTGTFDIELLQPLSMSLLVFDIVATPSNPTISVKVSSNGVTYTDANSVSLNGYRVSAWLPSQEVRFIRIAITPSHPDDLGGSVFTFGITDLNTASVQFQLMSELTSKAILLSPVSPQLRFVADADPGITFFLSINGQPYVEVASGDTFEVPDAQAVDSTGVAVDNTGTLALTLPGNVFLSTLMVMDAATNTEMPLAFGLSPSDPHLGALRSQYISVVGTTLALVQFDPAKDSARTFNVSFVQGDASVTINLRAQLTTEDRAVTPVFRGASFEEA